MSYDEYYAIGQKAKKEVRTPKYKQRVVADKKKEADKNACRGKPEKK